MIRCSCLREGRRPSPKSTRPKNMRSATAPMPLPSWWRGCFDASARGPGAQPQRLTAIVDREALGGQPINAEDGEMVARGVETAEDRQRADANAALVPMPWPDRDIANLAFAERQVASVDTRRRQIGRGARRERGW